MTTHYIVDPLLAATHITLFLDDVEVLVDGIPCAVTQSTL